MAAAHRRSLDLIICLLLMIGLFLVYLGVQRGEVASHDGKRMLDVTRSLVERRSLEPVSSQLVDDHGQIRPVLSWAPYGIGMSLLMIPGYLAQRALSDARATDWVTLTNPVIIAIAGAMLYWLGLQLGWKRGWALSASTIFGLLTMTLHYSTELFSEPAVALGLIVALKGLVASQRRQVWGGLVLGAGLAFTALLRTDAIVTCWVVLFALLLLPDWKKLFRDWRWLGGLLLPLVGVTAWIAFYNNLRWGSPFAGGYEELGFSVDLWTGLLGNTFSPGKGFFWFNPILILAIPGSFFLWKRNPVVAAAILLATASRVLFYAKWNAWYGGLAWGPRFMVPLTALLTVPAVEMLIRVSRAGRVLTTIGLLVATVLMSASLVVSVASVWERYERWWIDFTNPPAARLGVDNYREKKEAQAFVNSRFYEFFWTFDGGHISGNLSYVRKRRPSAPLRFRGDDSGGWLALSAGAIALFLSMVLSIRVKNAAQMAPKTVPS